MTLTKQGALNLFEQYRAELLDYSRWIAIKIAKENDGYCTIDQVREQISQLPKFKTLTVDPRVFGATFKKDMWEKVDTKSTKRPIAHGRYITIWKLKPEYRFRVAENGNLRMFE